MNVADLAITAREDGVRIGVRVKPRASRGSIAAVEDGALVVSLRSAPVEGAANAELIAVLAKALGVRKSDVAIAVGAGARRKLVDIRGIDAPRVRAALASALGSER